MQNMKSMVLPLLILLMLVVAAIAFTWQGVSMHNQVSVEEAKFHALQQEYFIINKAERESALTGTELNQKLVQIQNYPSELLRLKLVGIGKILTGVVAALLAIIFLLFMMPIRLGKMLRGENR